MNIFSRQSIIKIFIATSAAVVFVWVGIWQGQQYYNFLIASYTPVPLSFTHQKSSSAVEKPITDTPPVTVFPNVPVPPPQIFYPHLVSRFIRNHPDLHEELVGQNHIYTIHASLNQHIIIGEFTTNEGKVDSPPSQTKLGGNALFTPAYDASGKLYYAGSIKPFDIPALKPHESKANSFEFVCGAIGGQLLQTRPNYGDAVFEGPFQNNGDNGEDMVIECR